MTTVQTMLCAASLGAILLAGCAREKEALVAPNVIQSPYPSAKGETLWAIAPLANESGVSTIDTLAVSDMLAAAVAEVNGISALPVNRTLLAMHARDIKAIRTPREARLVADALKVQGLIVGSITAYDPYDPPKIGLTLALYTTDTDATDPVNPRDLSSSYSDRNLPKSSFSEVPSAVVSEHLDATNHNVLTSLREYSHGRHDPDSALSWKRYTASMELYTEFATYHCVRQLVQSERRRLASSATSNPNAANMTNAQLPAPVKPTNPVSQPNRHGTTNAKPSETTTHVPTGDTK